jgi:hypothetical protein
MHCTHSKVILPVAFEVLQEEQSENGYHAKGLGLQRRRFQRKRQALPSSGKQSQDPQGLISKQILERYSGS